MTSPNEHKQLPLEQSEALFNSLKIRFENNMHRHPTLEWASVQAKLKENPNKLWSLHEMERTGGEPDVVSFDQGKVGLVFYDCAAESPSGRRSICYDQEALDSRKKNKPENSADGMAKDMGIELLDEEQYRALQKMENFDRKTSSWIQTPSAIRKLKGALFCDFRYGTVFAYHNGAEYYYTARGFRGTLTV